MLISKDLQYFNKLALVANLLEIKLAKLSRFTVHEIGISLTLCVLWLGVKMWCGQSLDTTIGCCCIVMPTPIVTSFRLFCWRFPLLILFLKKTPSIVSNHMAKYIQYCKTRNVLLLEMFTVLTFKSFCCHLF